MPLTSDQQDLITRYTNTLLSEAMGRPDSPEAAALTEFMTAGEGRRRQLLKAWATQKLADDDAMVADQEARLTRITEERDTRKPVLQQIAALTRL